MTLCQVSGCDRDLYRKGYCAAHYGRLRRHGDPLGGRQMNGEATSWLAAHVEFSGSECLTWPFARSNGGRGKVKIHGREEGAHRAMCRLAHGNPESEELEAAHSCGKGHKGCVNPKHLRWATRQENVADKFVHGTTLRGDLSPGSKLTPDDVKNIRRLAAQALPQSVIATQYEIHQSMVSKIASGSAWSWLQNGESKT
ncbi:MAG: hypothetical protein ACEPO2_07345 [Pelagibaca sp.]